MKSKIFSGLVMHSRLEPVEHRFMYPVYFYTFDLDELTELDRSIHCFGYNRFRPVSIHDADYLQPGSLPVKEKLFQVLRRKGIDNDIDRVELITSARYFGYVFNPVSFYYCYRADGAIRCIVAEVNNTFGERHLYILDQPEPASDETLMHYKAAKAFHVSPFHSMEGEYDFYFSINNDALDVCINIVKDGKTVFLSRFWGNAVPFSSRDLLKTVLRFPLTAWFNMPRILKEAAKLYYRKRLSVYKKPFPQSKWTIRVKPLTRSQKIYASLLFKKLSAIRHGALTLQMPDRREVVFGDKGAKEKAAIAIKDNAFFKRIVRNGAIGFGESYLAGEWDTDNLTGLLRLLIQNLGRVDDGSFKPRWWMKAYYRARHLLRRNSLRGSKNNISEHYDVGNDFYQTILDSSMLYSGAIFNAPDETLEDAQRNKIHAVISKARINRSDHVLEIGSGWGGFAIEAVRQTGCRVTTVTISEKQYELATRRVRKAGLCGRIDVQLCDYRHITGQYDKIVSIEMIEAVGHEYLGEFFSACDRLLKPDGIITLQAITIPDNRYDRYRRESDWIQQYIFPGAVVPSLTGLCNAMTSHSTLFIEQVDNIGPHYAPTLREWRNRLNQSREIILELGYDERFIRAWNFYFAYCEAAFAERHLNNLHLVLTRQNNRSLDEPYNLSGFSQNVQLVHEKAPTVRVRKCG